jgi:hypothetical protein
LGSVPFNRLVLKRQQQPSASWQQQQQWQDDDEDDEDGEVELLDLGPAGVCDDAAVVAAVGSGAAAGLGQGLQVVDGTDGAEQAAAAAGAGEAAGDVAGMQQQQVAKQPRQFAFERHLQMLENTWKQPTA